MKSLLQKLMKDGKLCEIYESIDDEEGFYVGLIIAVDNESFVFRAITRYGDEDGFVALRIEDVCSIETDTEYLDALNVLLQHKKVDLSFNFTFELPLFYGVLKYAYENRLVCFVDDYDAGEQYGLINKLAKGVFDFEVLDDYGGKIQDVIVPIDDLYQVSILDSDTKRLDILSLKKHL